jgi:adenylylsulfate kinase-like enzyme
MILRNTLEQVTAEIEQSTPPVVVFGIGIPGSGKSTLLNAMGREFASTPVNVDDIRDRMRSSDWGPGGYIRLDEQIAAEVATHIADGGVALLDSPNCFADLRQDDILRYRSLGARTIGAVWLDVSLETAISRDIHRSRKQRVGWQTIGPMHAALADHEPCEAEGFDWLVRISE